MLRDSAGFYRALPTPHLEEGKVAVQATPPTQVPAGYDRYADDDERGYGWVMFAGVLLLMLGTLNFIEGLAAIGNAHFFTANAHYIAGSLNTWGWVVLCIGVLEWAVGCGVFVKNQFSRWTGVVVLGRQRDRAADDDPGVPVLVAVDLHARHPRDLRTDRVRQADLQRGLSTRNRRRGQLGVRHVFFRSRRHRSPQDKPRAADDSDAGIPETTLRQTQQLQDWRRSAQRVTRAWNAWLAAESRDRAIRYRVFVAALADEETRSRGGRTDGRPRRRGRVRHYDRSAEWPTGRAVRVKARRYQRSDGDPVGGLGDWPRGSWPLWARWNDELDQRYTLGVEEELMLLEPADWSLAQSSDHVLARLSDELSPHTSPETHAAVVELATGIHPGRGRGRRRADFAAQPAVVRAGRDGIDRRRRGHASVDCPGGDRGLGRRALPRSE